MRLLFLLLIFISISGKAQWTSYILSPKGDTLNKVDKKGLKQGPWSVHVEDLRGERGYEEEGYYENDLKEGPWKKYSLEGVKIAEENYRWGKWNGRQYYFTYGGGLIREESWRAIDPSVAFDTVAVYDVKDPSRVIDYAIIKNDGFAVKHGKWTYYEPIQGREEATENYIMNKLQTDDGLVSGDDIRPIDVSKGRSKSDTTGKATTKPKEVLDFEKKNSGKKKAKNRDGETGF